MDKVDYQGLATLVAAIAAAVVSILAAFQAFRNHKAVQEVKQIVNGDKEKSVVDAHKSGVIEGRLMERKAITESERGRYPPPNV